MEAEQVLSEDLAIGDVVRVSSGPFGDAIVKNLEPRPATDMRPADTIVTLYRPYGHSADFIYTGGVICYTGLEVWQSWQAAYTRVEKASPKQ
jgi:hypothetical protein